MGSEIGLHPQRSVFDGERVWSRGKWHVFKAAAISTKIKRKSVESLRSASMPSPRLSDSEQYALFDWLRFVLASVVVLSHIGILSWAESGNLAVQVFFALSGWLIGGILLRTPPSELPRFYFNRATRIWIPYAFAVVALYIVSFVRQPISSRWLEFLLYDVTFTHNWFSLRPDAATALIAMPLKGTGNHFWSIAVEEQFYLVAPLLIVFSRFGKRFETWMVVFLAAIWLNTNFASISAGVLAAAVRARFGDWQLKSASVLAVAAIASGIVMGLCDCYYWASAPVFALSLVMLAARPTARSSFGKLAGGISFPLYLNAWLGVFAVHAVLKNLHLYDTSLVGPLLTFAGALCAGAATYLLIDRNVMMTRDRYYTRATGIILGLAAYSLLLFGLCFGLVRWHLV